MFRFTHPVASSAIPATLLIALAFASPSFAAQGDLSGPNPSTSSAPRMMLAQAASSEGASAAAPAPADSESPVEEHIKDLHKRLQITAAQETQWNDLAKVMRDNAKAMQELEKARAHDVKTISAVDVVKSYESVIEAHEEGMKKFIPAFEALYNSMSDEQKKATDALFRGRASAAAKKATRANE